MQLKKRTILLLVIMIAVSYLCTLAVSADCGPKPSLTIYVENPPDELYYLDLLVEVKTKNTVSDSTYQYDNLKEIRDQLNQNMLTLLKSYEKEGWIPAVSDGDTPIRGGLEGYEDANNRKVHKFGYDIPRTFRVIVVTESGKVTVTETISTKSMESLFLTVFNDLHPYIDYRGIILLLFGFRLKDNWKPFILINIIHSLFIVYSRCCIGQRRLHICLHGTVPDGNYYYDSRSLVIPEVSHRKSKRLACGYGIVANLASWIIGAFWLEDLYNFLVKFM
jgi:hypothetical protein